LNHRVTKNTKQHKVQVAAVIYFVPLGVLGDFVVQNMPVVKLLRSDKCRWYKPITSHKLSSYLCMAWFIFIVTHA